MNNFMIADFISRLNIAKGGHMKSIVIKISKITLDLLKIFDNLGIIRGYNILNELEIEVFLKYNQSQAVIKKLELVSKPSKRIYVDIIKLNKLKEDYQGNILILSTNKGLLLDIDCIRNNIGGEVILRIVI